MSRSEQYPTRNTVIIQLYQAGLSLPAIGADFNLSRQRVLQIVRARLGVSRPPRYQREAEAIRAARARGLSVAAIIAEFGLSQETVEHALLVGEASLPPRICPVCDETFTPRSVAQRYCCRRHRNRAAHRRFLDKHPGWR